MFKVDLDKHGKFALYSAILFTVVIMFIFLSTLKYKEFYDIRVQQYNSTKETMTMCERETKKSSDKDLMLFCERTRLKSNQLPEIYALKDLVCLAFPCSLFDTEQSESIFVYMFDLISGRAITFIVAILSLYVVGVFLGLISIKSTTNSGPIILPVYVPQYSAEDREHIENTKCNTRKRITG